MGSESSLWNTLRNNMKDRWRAERIENGVGLGTPDVYATLLENGSMHWIELKHVHEYPKRITTIVNVDHFTAQQKGFIRRHHKAGANVWVLIQIKRDYYLFHGLNSLKIGELTKLGYQTDADYQWQGSIDYEELSYVLAINS